MKHLPWVAAMGVAMMAPSIALAQNANRISGDAPEVVYRQPQLAGAGSVVAVTYGSRNSVHFVRSDDGGKSFSSPVKVSDAGKVSIGMHMGPRVAIAKEGIVISAVVGGQGRGTAVDLVSWRSLDGGKTWSPAVKINDVPGAPSEGLHAMAYGGRNMLFATWLDSRSKGTKLYGAVSTDGGASWSRNYLVYESPSGSVCECCHPTALIDADGRITVMFRNSLNGARDFYLVRSQDEGKTFEPARKLGEGTWELNACPMDGGSLTATRAGQVVSVWRRQQEIFQASPGEKEISLGVGKDPAVAEGTKGIYTAWTGRSGAQAHVPGQAEPVVFDPTGAYVQLLALPQGRVLAAWESQGAIFVQQLP